MARTMLATNTKNRKLRRTRINQYAEQMRRGQWQPTGEAIKFAKDGTLLDGQHRLHAIIEANVELDMLVVQDLDLSTFKVIDSGLTRTPGDALQLMGITNSNHKAAAIRMYIAADAQIQIDSSVAMTNLITRTDITNFIAGNEELVNSAVNAARNVYNNCRGNRPAWAALYMMITKKYGQAEAEMFFQSVSDGTNMSPGDPRLALRNWAVRNTSNPYRGEHLYAYCRAYNAYRSNDAMHLLRLPIPAHRKPPVID